MPENKATITIGEQERPVMLTIYGESTTETTVFEISEQEAYDNGEAPVQITEGCFYEYEISKGYYLENSEIVTQSKVNPSSGRIAPNIYVGTLTFPVFDITTKTKCGAFRVEVRSEKTSYRKDYRQMLEDITEHCTELLMQHSSPASQYFEPTYDAPPETLYQRFAFIKSILDSEEFDNAIHKILAAPVTKWKLNEEEKDIRSVKRMGNRTIKQFASASNRIDLDANHALKQTLGSVPRRIITTHKIETVDTQENRFIKHALQHFLAFITDIRSKLDSEKSRIKTEVNSLEDKLEQYLTYSVFKEISPATALHLNSPVLQRKEGYREVLRVWLMFDLAAKLVWHGGDDVYSADKRDVAVLYEYWVFFKLLAVVKKIFNIELIATKEMIEPTSDGLGLKLKQGKYLAIEGMYSADTRKLRIAFSYNKSFSGNNTYPKSGSWTRNLRPDYTLSIWPNGINEDEAETQELIVHIHFDAKYKIDNLAKFIKEDEDLDIEKTEQKKGTYKRADLLKMHTYRDAIRRTAGAYVLYPGDRSYKKEGFHEVLPGLGAFPIKPSQSNDGTIELESFLKEVVQQFLNRASQREMMSFRTYETHIDSKGSMVNEDLPEPYGINRALLPTQTFVLVAYYKKENLEWIKKNGIYNARAESARGSLRLGPGEAGAKFLLLHTEGETITSKLFRIKDTGPRVLSKHTLIKKGYPGEPSQDYYFVYTIEPVTEPELTNKGWDITQLEGYKSGRGSALPFACTLAELRKNRR